jgi:hypothetical protein
VIERSPRLLGETRSRWWLAGIRGQVTWLQSRSLSTVSNQLRRLGLRYKRGRLAVHSPDAHYDLKLAYIAAAQAQVARDPQRVVLLYSDELTYYRRPSVAQAYAPVGQAAPVANSGHGRNRTRRIAGALDSVTGQFWAWQRAAFDHQTLLRYWEYVVAQYPQAERVYLVVDNWPVHFHPTLLLHFLNSKVTLLRLPTYAPWTDPVEDVWRLLYQRVLHLHEYGDEWVWLQGAVQVQLDEWQVPSTELLQISGLCPN